MSRGVVAFKEKDMVGVVATGSSFDVVEVATQHCDELRCVFEQVDADERGVPSPCDVTQGTCLHSGRPFKVPPELGSRTVASRGREAGVAACDAVGDARDQMGDWACLWCVGHDNVRSMRRRLRRRSPLMWWRSVQPWIDRAVAPEW